MNESDTGYATNVARYLKLQARYRKKVLDNIERDKAKLEKIERRMNLASDPDFFNKMTGHLANRHQVSKSYVSTLRFHVKGA